MGDLKQNQKGAVAILTLLAISVFALAVMSTVSVLAANALQMSSADANSDKTFYAAEAGVNEALNKLITNPVPEPFSLSLNGVNVQITVTSSSDTTPCASNPDNPYPRIIQSQATDSTGKERTVQIIACSSAFSGGFNYAVQGGAGGIFMDQNSYIIGKVYSNADIIGSNGAEVRTVSGTPGDVWVADTNTLDNVHAFGDVRAHAIKNSTIGGHAYYQTVIGTVKANNGSDTCTENENGPNCFDGSADQPQRDLPINDADVQNWKDDISDPSNPNTPLGPSGGSCPANTYCVSGSATLGRQKINGNFYLGNGATLTLTGNLWVSGNITLDNNGAVKLSDDLGGGSTVIISDGTINVENNLSIQGNSDPRSFLLVLSTSNSGVSDSCSDPHAVPTVYASNNSTAIIFAAIHGLLKVKNNGHLNAAAVQKLCLENGANVTFNTNLASFTVPGGGGDTVGTALGTWQEK